ncbi:MAG: hypothetical protein IPO83_06875 [Chitinophagaceae bacterium]|nr:hypothetical protein [Chitinophagaceae bacterium]
MATKSNNTNRSSNETGVELGAWIFSTVFFISIVWIMANILHRIFFF